MFRSPHGVLRRNAQLFGGQLQQFHGIHGLRTGSVHRRGLNFGAEQLSVLLYDVQEGVDYRLVEQTSPFPLHLQTDKQSKCNQTWRFKEEKYTAAAAAAAANICTSTVRCAISSEQSKHQKGSQAND